MRADAGHVEGSEHALGFTQVVPANTGDSDHREAIRPLCENLMRKVDLVETFIEIVDGLGLRRSSEQRDEARKRPV